MLVISRKLGEEIVIGDGIRISVLRRQGDRVRLGIIAPSTVHIIRREIVARNDSHKSLDSQIQQNDSYSKNSRGDK
jgi:carbon storage regulator